MTILKVKRGESKIAYFAITHDGQILNLTSSTLSLKVYDENDVLRFEKTDADFDKTEVEVGEFTVLLNETDLDLDPDIYYGYVKIVIGSFIDKTVEFVLIVKSSLI